MRVCEGDVPSGIQSPDDPISRYDTLGARRCRPNGDDPRDYRVNSLPDRIVRDVLLRLFCHRKRLRYCSRSASCSISGSACSRAHRVLAFWRANHTAGTAAASNATAAAPTHHRVGVRTPDRTPMASADAVACQRAMSAAMSSAETVRRPGSFSRARETMRENTFGTSVADRRSVAAFAMRRPGA